MLVITLMKIVTLFFLSLTYKTARKRRRKNTSLKSPAKRRIKGLSSKKENSIEPTNNIKENYQRVYSIAS